MTNPIQELPSVDEYYPKEYPELKIPKNLTAMWPNYVGSPDDFPSDPNSWKKSGNVEDIDPALVDSPTKYVILDENNVVVGSYVEIRTDKAIEEQTEQYHFYKANGIPHPTKSKFIENLEYDETKTKLKVTDEMKGAAAIGNTYDAQNKRFIPPCEFEGYILDEDTCTWVPEEGREYDLHGDGIMYTYNKELKVWDLVQNLVE